MLEWLEGLALYSFHNDEIVWAGQILKQPNNALSKINLFTFYDLFKWKFWDIDQLLVNLFPDDKPENSYKRLELSFYKDKKPSQY